MPTRETSGVTSPALRGSTSGTFRLRSRRPNAAMARRSGTMTTTVFPISRSRPERRSMATTSSTSCTISAAARISRTSRGTWRRLTCSHTGTPRRCAGRMSTATGTSICSFPSTLERSDRATSFCTTWARRDPWGLIVSPRCPGRPAWMSRPTPSVPRARSSPTSISTATSICTPTTRSTRTYLQRGLPTSSRSPNRRPASAFAATWTKARCSSTTTWTAISTWSSPMLTRRSA